MESKPASSSQQQLEQKQQEIWEFVMRLYIYTGILWLCGTIFFLVLALFRGQCSKSMLVLFLIFLGIMLMLGCCAFFAPWHHNFQKKHFFVIALQVATFHSFWAMYLEVDPLFGPLAPWFLLDSSVATIVIVYCYVLFLYRQT